MTLRLFTGILVLLILSGCGTGLKQRWNNFNAYYNTFYNAEVSYKRGLTLIENQTYVINPERPIRIHRTPLRAGQTDFEKAIEKSADVLRNHADTKWMDDALELIGKSYFYQTQYFSAEQKFNEILATSTNNNVRQRAILWKGLVFLETNRFNDGINYLTSSLESDEYNWDDQTLKEVHLILAQLFVEEEDFEQAALMLSAGLPGFRNDVLRSRGSFLYGQILQQLGQYSEALTAYRGVSRKYPEYQLIYLANLKQNEILREQGEYNLVVRNLNSMTRDDKNFEQRADLNYEIGRTLQYMGAPYEAFNTFKDVLYNSIRPPSRETIAKTHYALAELHRFDFYDYRLAAAYYDSASRNATELEKLPYDFDATDLSRSFGDYARLSKEISEMDSLLQLGLLPPDEFQQVLATITEERQREYERQLRQEQLRGTTLVNVNQQGTGNTDTSRDNGYLNHRNPELMAQASESFAALWDGRPLVDNWRRLEAVRSAIVQVNPESNGTQDAPASERPADGSSVRLPELNIDTSEIPFTEEAQAETRERIASREYEIGNVFYLNLGMPDSALVHYNRVIYELGEVRIRSQAIYTKADIYLSQGDSLSAQKYVDMLFTDFPTDRIAIRMAERLDVELPAGSVLESEDELMQRDFDELLLTLNLAEPTDRITKLDAFIIEYPESPMLPDIYMNKALVYASLGRENTEFVQKIRAYSSAMNQWTVKSKDFASKKNEALSRLNDIDTPEEERPTLQILADSTLSQPKFDHLFPYVGEEWDSTRVNLLRIIEGHSRSRFAERAQSMMETLALPESLQPAVEESSDEEIPLQEMDSEAVQENDSESKPKMDSEPTQKVDHNQKKVETEISGLIFTADGNYAVQVSSWRSIKNANDEVNLWKQRGFPITYIMNQL
jgi:tetratricopeptide (TPR) repeat protein